MGQAQHRAARGGLGAHALGVDGDVDRPGGRAQDEQRRAQARGRGRQPGERGRAREGGERRRERGPAPAVDERPRQAHRKQGAGADAQQGDPELAVVDAGVRLHRGQRGAPCAPEDAEGGEAAQHPRRPATRPAYQPLSPSPSPGWTATPLRGGADAR